MWFWLGTWGGEGNWFSSLFCLCSHLFLQPLIAEWRGAQGWEWSATGGTNWAFMGKQGASWFQLRSHSSVCVHVTGV